MRYEATMTKTKLQSERAAESDNVRATPIELIEVHNLTLKEALHLAVLSLPAISPKAPQNEFPRSPRSLYLPESSEIDSP
jgi:hypothetical protein